jgi:hypothetical protein
MRKHVLQKYDLQHVFNVILLFVFWVGIYTAPRKDGNRKQEQQPGA